MSAREIIYAIEHENQLNKQIMDEIVWTSQTDQEFKTVLASSKQQQPNFYINYSQISEKELK